MNFCSSCGTSLTRNAKFCSECGASTSLDLVDAIETGSYKVFSKGYMAFLAGVVVVTLAVIGVMLHGRSSADASADTAHISETSTTTSTTVDSDMPPSDSEGYYEQPKTCLQWKTNYAQRYVGGTGGSTWNGSSWVQSNPGRWEQYPTGQTCVRYG